MTREELVTERLRIFTDRISPTLQIFSSMFATALGKQLARGDDLEPTFAAMDIHNSLDDRRERRLPTAPQACAGYYNAASRNAAV
jgi:hypothetical protein